MLVSLKHCRGDVVDNFAKLDDRGKHPPHHILDPIVIDEIDAYIESYKPPIIIEEHELQFPDYDPECEICVLQMSHIENTEQSRKDYTKEKMKDNNEHEVIVSVDMQKVMLLMYKQETSYVLLQVVLIFFH